MKKTIKTTSLAIATALMLGANLFAQGFPPQSTQGGFQGPTINSTTVADAKKLRDDTAVILIGKIEKSLGNEKYFFSDNTGSIIVEIDNEDWGGLTITPQDTIEIHGEIDKDLLSIEIDVNRIVKK
ncbi:MAG: NirD/YgiW/YdeI family stress tolerance protein [Elusimicrobiota bacterium]|jgi:uncharacterized protein (TIGR00156 family)|nr:NirD/YgiW/YdeI family stress tolerance protein [Elusimicrobiota bacterium]